MFMNLISVVHLQLKKILSSIPEAPINVESLANDVDVSAVVTRDTFVELAKPVLERVKGPLEEVRIFPFCVPCSM